MENLTIAETCVVVIGAVLAVAGVVNTLGSAVEKIIKVIKAAKEPNIVQDERLDKHEEELDEMKEFLANDKKHLAELDKSTRITMRAQLALLSHGLDGNAVDQMKAAKQEIENYLISK